MNNNRFYDWLYTNGVENGPDGPADNLKDEG